MNRDAAIVGPNASTRYLGRTWFALGMLVVVAGCGGAPETTLQSSHDHTASVHSTSAIRPTAEPNHDIENENAALPVPVGDDPAASLTLVAQRVRKAVERFDKVEKLIYPRGWHRQRAVVLAVSSELSPQEAQPTPQAGIVRIRIHDQYSLIHPTREEAAGDDELYPRRPFPSLDAMLNDRVNPPRDPVDLILRYEVREGTWQRIDWEGPGRLARGADWFDQLQAP